VCCETLQPLYNFQLSTQYTIFVIFLRRASILISRLQHCVSLCCDVREMINEH